MNSAPSDTASRRSFAGRLDLAWPRLDAAGAGASVLFVMTGPLLAGLAYALKQPALYFDGDNAVDELALMNSGHLAQLVGNYSRFRWSHPGPAWFYALDVVYQPLGGHSWGFVVATLLLNAIVLALIVIAVWLARGPLLAVLAAALLLLYVGGLGDQLFRDPWPPFAVILPMCLLFFLAASAAAGSLPALMAALIVGSYLAQTHLGTAPTVAAVIGGAVLVRLITGSASGGRRQRSHVPLVAATVAILGLVWAPPVIDELANRPGNLTLIWTFFTSPHQTHRYLEAISVLGRFLWVPEIGQLRTLHDQDLAAVSPAYLAVAGTFSLFCLGLIGTGTLGRDRFAQALGVIIGAALVAIVVSIHSVSGPVYAYLLHWVSTLPLVLAVGWLSVAVGSRRFSRMGAPDLAGIGGWTALLLVVIGLSVARAAGFLALPPPPVATADTHEAWAYTAAALTAEPHQPVVLELNTTDTWVLAAGIGLQLAKAGYPVRVHDDMLFMYGPQARMTGREMLALIVVDGHDLTAFEAGNPDARLIGQTQLHGLFLRRLHP